MVPRPGTRWAPLSVLVTSMALLLGLLGMAPAGAAEAPPAPAPAAGAVVAIPAAGSATASPETGVSITGASPAQIGSVQVTGGQSGPHAGRLAALPDGAGVAFTPDVDFQPGEVVEVTSGVTVSGATGPTYTFTVATPAPHPGVLVEEGEAGTAPSGPTDRSGSTRADPPVYATRPDLHPPGVDINVPANGTAPGLLFSTPGTFTGGNHDQGVFVYDDAGETVWFHPVTNEGVTIGDATVVTYRNQPALTWFEGRSPFGGNFRGEWIVVDTSYRELARLTMGNGYRADIHDISFTDHDTAYLVAYSPLVCTGVAPLDGCVEGATVFDGVVQEIDLATNQVLWEWHSLDHVPLSDSYLSLANPTLDYIHLNSVALDTDGNVLLSARNTSALYKVDRQTGGLIWTFGGRHTSFPNLVGAPTPGPTPDFPHHLRTLGGGSYSFFDNGSQRQQRSRAHVVALNPATGTATITQSLEHDPPIFVGIQGNNQALPGGRRLVSWGNSGVATEYDASGNVIFDASLSGTSTYRQFRHQWTGAPASRPVAVARAAGGGATSVAVSWNGDTRTTQWRILAGDRIDALAPVATVSRDGFETTTTIPGRPAHIAVEALAGSTVLDRSAPVAGAAFFAETPGPRINGTYQPLVGDFGGGRNDDIVYYQPGTGPDFLHVSDAAGGFASTLLPSVNGTYKPLVGDFVGDERDEVLWTAPGSTAASLWRFDLRPRGEPVGIASAGVSVPATVTKAIVLDHRRSYIGGYDEVLFYAAGSAPDRIDHFSWPRGAALTRTSRGISVSGSYLPISGDYDGNGQADVLWYAPGAAPDTIWLLDGDEAGTTGQRSVSVGIGGDYQVFAGNFAGAEDRDELAFFSSGPGADHLWTFDPSGAHTSQSRTSSAAGVGLPLEGGNDSIMTWLPGAATWILPFRPGPVTAMPSGNTPVGDAYYPIIGDFVGTVGTSSVLWYAAGSAPERLDVGS